MPVRSWLSHPNVGYAGAVNGVDSRQELLENLGRIDHSYQT
jgi:hypothetical protein